jgi:hypothetical protein
MPPVRIAALIVGDPRATELWALRRLASIPGSLTVIRAERGSGLSGQQRLRYLVRQHGVWPTVSRVVAGRSVGAAHERRMRRELASLFDEERLHEWWRRSGIPVMPVPYLNHPATCEALSAVKAEIVVRLSGGVLKKAIFGGARIAALNIHHGMAPLIRGMWSIPWGLVERRAEWVGATVHQIDDGIDTGPVLWRGSPQLAPGDTATTVFFRVHLEAVEALVAAIGAFARGETPDPVLTSPDQPSVYRSAPGLGAWTRFLWLGEGRRAPLLLERALKG